MATKAGIKHAPLDKPASEWKLSDFRLLPHRGYAEACPPLCSLLILPTRKLHESGFRIMHVVGEVMTPAGPRVHPYILTGCSDVICIEGIGGFGKDWTSRPKSDFFTGPKHVAGWSIDVLRNGIVRLFVGEGQIVVDAGLSSFCVYSEPKPGSRPRS